ncbi:MAG: response regulator [Nitrospirota bacterium]
MRAAQPLRKVIVPERVLALLKKQHSFLDREGIKILPASSNREALELHRAERADLVVAELDSPEMSGEELCSAVRDDSGLRQVSIMVLCADSDDSMEGLQGKLAGHSENISASGILVITEAELNEGDSIACTFTLPEGGTFSVEATVVRVMEEPGGKKKYGLSFPEPGEATAAALALFAKKLGCQ